MATELLTQSLNSFISIYLILIFVRILLSWFQTENWANQAMGFLAPVTDPYLNIFRSFIPPLGGLDLSPVIAIIVLQTVSQLIGAL